MSVTIDELVEITANVLHGATDAGGNVYTPGDWPSHGDEYPYIRLQAPREDRESDGNGGINFECVATIRITARVTAPGAPSDAGGEDAEDKLWRLKKQIDRTVINHDDFAKKISDWPFVRSQVGIKADAEQHVAELVMEVGLKYYQGWEDFYQTAETVITDFDEKTPVTDPTFATDFAAAGG